MPDMPPPVAPDPYFDGPNPYASPKSSLGEGENVPAGARRVPPTLFGKFGLALSLLGGNFSLISLIVLTVWLPGNLILGALQSQAADGGTGLYAFRYAMFVEGIFGPMYVAALIYALDRRFDGARVGYFEAMGVGLSCWGPLFGARFAAGLVVMLGLIALVIPGIVLQLRYSLLDNAVVLEQSSDPRARSTALTGGRRLSILAAGAITIAFQAAVGFALGLAIELGLPDAGEAVYSLAGIASDCVVDIVGVLMTVVLFLYYREARQDEQRRAALALGSR